VELDARGKPGEGDRSRIRRGRGRDRHDQEAPAALPDTLPLFAITAMGCRTAPTSRRILPLYEGVDLGLPAEDRFSADPVGKHLPVLGDLSPGSAGRSGRPVVYDVLGGGARWGGEIGEVRDDHGDLTGLGVPAPPGHHLLVAEVDVDEFDVVDREGVAAGAKLDEARDMVLDPCVASRR